MSIPKRFRERSTEEKRNGVVITGEPLKIKSGQKKRFRKKVAKNEECLDYTDTCISSFSRIRSGGNRGRRREKS